MIGVTRIKYFKKSGGRLYLSQDIINHSDFPFKDDDLVKIEIHNQTVIVSKPEWYELLDWDEMNKAYELLPHEIKEKVDRLKGED